MSAMRRILLAAFLGFIVVSSGLAASEPLQVTPDHADGVYQVGQAVHWRVEWKGDSPAPASINFTLKRGGLTNVGSGSLELAQGQATIDATLDQPGTLLAEVKAKSSDGKDHRALGGAVAGADQIKPSAAAPDDFDSFWQSKIQELEAVPPEPQLEKGDAGKEGVDYYKLTLNNIHGSHIQGQLARPTQGEKFPAL